MKNPQFDLPIPDEPMRLVVETALDGERIAGEHAQLAADRLEAEQHQPVLTTR